MKKFSLVSLSIIFFTIQLNAQNYLQKSLDKQVLPFNKTLNISYTENSSFLNHGFKPWKTTEYNSKGIVQSDGRIFINKDTIITGTKKLFSTYQLADHQLLLIDYNQTEYSAVDNNLAESYLLKTIRYYPAYLLKYVYDKNPQLSPYFENNEYAGYRTSVNNVSVEFKIRKSDYLIEKIRTLYDDVQGFGKSLGDMEDIYSYSDYAEYQGIYIPQNIRIEKLNRKISDKIEITRISFQDQNLTKWEGTAPIKEEETKTEIEATQHSDHIYLVDIKQENTVSLLVEFKDFFVAIEAPKSSENGEQIISQARKIAPDKPVKYFVAGHFHPHYLGGLRSFVHKGSTILSIQDNYEYIVEQVSNPHTITTDSLEIENKPLKFESIEKDTPYTISDGDYEMQIIFIGEKSDHTYDYLVFYFPHEKMLYEGDLLFIPEQGEVKRLGKRGMSCYEVIKDHNLKVDTILQAWPVNAYGVKWKIPFDELEQIVKKFESVK